MMAWLMPSCWVWRPTLNVPLLRLAWFTSIPISFYPQMQHLRHRVVESPKEAQW